VARGHRGRTIDYKGWLGIAALDAPSITTATTSKGASLAFTAPATILRCRGYVQANFDATQQIADTMGIAFGLGIVSSDAVAAGAGSLPDPFGDADYPWLWWQSMFLRSEIAAGVHAWGLSAQRIDVDTKAMRRVKPGQSLVMVFETATVVGAPVTAITVGFMRVLIGT